MTRAGVKEEGLNRETRLHPPDVKERLVRMSPTTTGRLLATHRHKERWRWVRTKPNTLLRQGIPVRTFADWNDARPGFLGAELVVHCGKTTAGG